MSNAHVEKAKILANQIKRTRQEIKDGETVNICDVPLQDEIDKWIQMIPPLLATDPCNTIELEDLIGLPYIKDGIIDWAYGDE